MKLLREYFKSLLNEEKTLFHGTSIFDRNSIERFGLLPGVGHFVKSSYGMSQVVDPEDCEGAFDDDCAHSWGNDNEDYERCVENAEYECRQEADRFTPAVFFADKATIGSALGGIVASIAGHLGKDFHDVSDEEIKKYGILAIIKDADLQQMPDHDQISIYDDPPAQAEPGDYYSLNIQTPDLILRGKNMLRMLKRYGAWPRDWGFDESKNKELLIRLALKHYGSERRDEIVKAIENMTPSEQKKWINKLK